MNLYFLKYNNYYNRIVKTEKNDNELFSYTLTSINDINFNPNDGITTSQIVNLNPSEFGNYCFLAEDRDILSRWFILDYVRLLGGQYKLFLKRDVVAESFRNVLNAPMLVERGYVPSSDPLILNREETSFNKIKVAEGLLKDKTGTAWVVGYIAKNKPDTDKTITLKLQGAAEFDYTASTLDEFKTRIYGTNKHFLGYDSVETHVFYSIAQDYGEPRGVENVMNKYNQYSYYKEVTLGTNSSSIVYDLYLYDFGSFNQNFFNNIDSAIIAQKERFLDTFGYENNLEQLKDYFNKIVYISSEDKYYRITSKVAKSNIKQVIYGYDYTKNTNLEKYINSHTNHAGANIIISGKDTVSLFVNSYDWELELEEYTETFSYVLKANHNTCADAPYDIFCININYFSGVVGSKIIAVSMAQKIQEETGGNTEVYDLQLLPYCPAISSLTSEGTLPTNFDDYITNEHGGRIGVVLWSRFSELTFDIDNPTITTKVPGYEIPTQIENNTISYKAEHNLVLRRLCSPAMASFFEFSLASNLGDIKSYNVDMVARPYNPYIHVTPKFNTGSFYGMDFNDIRGLSCNDDFSITQINNAFATYEMQNKNYQAMFDRQMQNMDVNYEVKRQQQIISSVVGTVQGGVTGGVAGSQFGTVGTAIGAIGGGATSFVGAALDYQNMEKLFKESKSYATDVFTMNLENIKALPNTITKSSVLSNNNKIFPFIEIYTCTAKEKDYFIKTVNINAFNKNAVSTIIDSINLVPAEGYRNFVKGKLIKIEIDEDNHYAQELANELQQGVYFEYLVEKGVL